MTVSIAIQAHPSRRTYAEQLAERLGATIAWSQVQGDVWDTHRRARLLAGTAADWNLVVQDDSLLCRDFDKRLAATLRTPQHLCSLFFRHRAGLAQMNGAARNGLRKGGFLWPIMQWGVAVAVPSQHVADMVAFCEAMDSPPHHDDQRIRVWALERHIKTWYPLPVPRQPSRRAEPDRQR